ncbi:primase-helicase family protein [Brevundimonas faecalis]|uniref:primase-helicase family protein n=1 Tax=Brevundimonas faecalis TaxID=947378 RepID=UPI003618F16A
MSNTITLADKRKIVVGSGDKHIAQVIEKEKPELYRQIVNSQYDEFEYLKKRVAQVKVGGKVRYVDFTDSDLVFYTAADMALILGERRVLSWKGEWVPAFRWWQGQKDRKQFGRVVFEPNFAKVRDGDLNLFKGFHVRPNSRAGTCEKFKQHLRDNICDGNDEAYQYLRKWMASLFQNPGEKIGVAVVLYSPEKGTGKTFVGEYVAYCLGEEYSPAVSTPEGLTGKHNSHLAKAMLVRVEEAIHAKDPRHDSQLKHLITSPRVMVEPKGIDAFEIDSKANFIFSSNREQVVPATAGERRFFVLRVATHKVRNRAYFKAIKAERNSGGAEAFVAEMMAEDLTDFDIMEPPTTEALGDQIVEGLTGLDRWWRDVLTEGRLPWRREAADGAPCELGWPESGAWTVHCAVVQQSAADHVRSYQGPPSPASVGRFISKVTGADKQRESTGERAWCYILPSLDDCRAAFVQQRKGLLPKHVGGAQAALVVTDEAQAASGGGGNVVALKQPRRVKRFG